MLALRILRTTTKKGRILGASILVCATLFLANSCDTAFGLNSKGYEHFSEDLANSWRRAASFTYMTDNNNYWKSPKEFEHDGGGDCEDFCFYLMYYLGKESRVYFIQLNGRSTIHAIVYYEGKFIEPQVYGRTYDPSQFKVMYWLGYADAMLLSTNYGLKNQTGVKSAETTNLDLYRDNDEGAF